MLHSGKQLEMTDGRVKTKVIYPRVELKKVVFHLMMVFLIMIPVFLFLYYVYYSDNQPQGRYLMPALYPLMYFVTLGWNNILTKNSVKMKRCGV